MGCVVFSEQFVSNCTHERNLGSPSHVRVDSSASVRVVTGGRQPRKDSPAYGWHEFPTMKCCVVREPGTFRVCDDLGFNVRTTWLRALSGWTLVEDGVLWRQLRSPQLRITEWGDRGVFVFTKSMQSVPAVAALDYDVSAASTRKPDGAQSCVSHDVFAVFREAQDRCGLAWAEVPVWVRRLTSGRGNRHHRVFVAPVPRDYCRCRVVWRVPVKVHGEVGSSSVGIVCLEPRLCAAPERSLALCRYHPAGQHPAMAAASAAAASTTPDTQRNLRDDQGIWDRQSYDGGKSLRRTGHSSIGTWGGTSAHPDVPHE